MSVVMSLTSRPGNTRNEALREDASIRRYFRWALRHDVADTDPTLGVHVMELVVCRKCSIGEILSIFSNPPMTLMNPFGVVGEMTVLELLYGSGLRVAELCSPIGHHSTSTIRRCVWGKGSKEREFRLVSPPAMPSQHGEIRHEAAPSEAGDALFTNERGRRLTSRVRRILDRRSATPTHPHALRHTFATHLLDGGADAEPFKSFLGMPMLRPPSGTRTSARRLLRRIANRIHEHDTSASTPGRTTPRSRRCCHRARRAMESLESQAGVTARDHPRALFTAGQVRRCSCWFRPSPFSRSSRLDRLRSVQLIDAIEKFDPSHGVKFETYAAPRIRRFDGLHESTGFQNGPHQRSPHRTGVNRARARTRPFSSEDELAVHLEISIDELATWLSEVAATVGTLDRAISMGFEPEADELDGHTCRGGRSRRASFHYSGNVSFQSGNGSFFRCITTRT